MERLLQIVIDVLALWGTFTIVLLAYVWALVRSLVYDIRDGRR
jgi:hypothetical protein